EVAVAMVRQEKRESVRARAAERAEERLLQLLLPTPAAYAGPGFGLGTPGAEHATVASAGEPGAETREKLREQLRAGRLDGRMVEVEVEEQSFPSFEMVTPQGVEEVGINLKDMMPGLFGGKSRKRRVTVAEARDILVQQEGDRLIDRHQ